MLRWAGDVAEAWWAGGGPTQNTSSAAPVVGALGQRSLPGYRPHPCPPGRQEQGLWEPALRFWALAGEGLVRMARVKEEAKGRAAAEKEEWGFHGLGVMRSEWRTEPGCRRTEEKGEPRRGKRMVLTFTLPGGGGVCDALGWCFIACRSKEGVLGGCQAQEAKEACPGQRAPLSCHS